MTKPPDAPTVTSTAWALALHHVTLGIDDVRISPWSDSRRRNAGGTDPLARPGLRKR
jgi:hypothetical protein